MPSWWPYGRRKPLEPQETSSQAPPPVSESTANPDSTSHSEKITTNHRAASTEATRTASARAETSLASDFEQQARAHQRSARPLPIGPNYFSKGSDNIAASPHLRPVRSSVINSKRSSDLHTSKSGESGILRRLSTLHRRRDRTAQSQSTSRGSRVAEKIPEEPEKLNRTGSKRKRNTGSELGVPRRASNPSYRTSPSTKSGMTTVTTDTRFDVGSILSPHPKIRYSSQTPRESNLSLAKSGISARTYSKNTLHLDKTVDDLANDLDAAAIRKLMDRDQKRQDKKRKIEEERATQRLQVFAARNAPAKLPKDDHPFSALYDIPADAGPSNRKDARKSSDVQGASRYRLRVNTDRANNPFADPPQSSPSLRIARSSGASKSPFGDSEIYTARSIRYSQASLSPPASPKVHVRNPSNLSHVTDFFAASTPNMPVNTIRRLSNSSGRSTPFAGLFRKNKSGTSVVEESLRPARGSFSNLSRDSMSRTLPPSNLRDDRPLSAQRPVTASFRAKSRFVEDLPESPISPPESRLQSPLLIDMEVKRSAPMPIVKKDEDKTQSNRQRSRTDSLDPETNPTSAVTLSQSLASVDSEASWLSGKRSSRMSPRASISPKRVCDTTPLEEMPNREVDAFARIPIPARNPARGGLGGIQAAISANQQSEGLELMPSPLEEEVIHGEVSRKNTVLHKGSRVKSAEGLMHQWGSEGPITPPREHKHRGSLETADSEDDAVEPETPYIESAHARHMSTGSARLLNVPARQDSLRSSQTSFQPMYRGY